VSAPDADREDPNVRPKPPAAVTPDTPTAAAVVRPPLGAKAIAAWLLWVLAVVAAGSLVGVFFAPGAWFAGLAKPDWNPPSWLFGPVWTLLYALMGTAAWLVWREPVGTRAERRGAWLAFAVHALLNLAWTPLFFGLQQPGLAFADICAVWLALLATTLRFGRLRPLAGYLLLPQVLWVSFALVLNGTIWLMNT
jgi:benzodiazapine receptor